MKKVSADYLTASPDRYGLLKDFAHQNRNVMTDAELLLWRNIRHGALGVKFRRQHIIGDYIVDFICLSQKIVIEVDGGYHEEESQKREDLIRQKRLESMGYTVLRFSNSEIFESVENVLLTIKKNITLNLPF